MGEYYVVVTNAYGSTTSDTATLSLPSTNLVLWLTFDQDDGWTTNHIITDRSGMGNNAYYMASTNHQTWPTWTNGPGSLSAAQFVTNWVNLDGQTLGTYAAIPTTNGAGGLSKLTNATFAAWAYVEQPWVTGNHGGAFLTTGIEASNWWFGKYGSDGPQFSRIKVSGEFPWETYTRWPDLSVSAWHHYTVSWAGGYVSNYLDGASYSASATWTNDYSRLLTNFYGGTLTATNSGYNGTLNQWIALGVGHHSQWPVQYTDGGVEYGPNYGQFWGRLADVRIYNRALTAAEVAALYALGAPAVTNVPTNLRRLY